MQRHRKSTIVLSLAIGCLPWISDVQAQNLGTPVSITVGTLPDDAAMIFWSTRNESNPLGPSNLYVANLSGGNVTRMTFSAKRWEHAALSFDRRYIAGNRYPSSGASSLWIIDLINRTEVQVLPTYYYSGGGGMDWSPDGFVFFSSQQVNGGATQVYKIKPDGTGFAQLTSHVLDPFSEPPDPAGAGDVSVSEDGSKVAYVRVFARMFPNGAWGPKPQIWIMNSDGTDQHMVYDDPRTPGMSGADPVGTFDPEFSPDGSKVLFSRTNIDYANFPQYGVNTAHDLVTMNADGTGELFSVTSPGPVSIIPDWQNGKILYTEYWDANAIGSGTNYTGSVLINPDGTGKARLESGLSLWRGARHAKFIRPTTNPSACSGDWTNCSRANTSASDRATANVNANSTKTGTWSNFGFSVPATATVHSITVLPTFYATGSTGQIEVSVSGDGGVTYGPPHVVGGNTSEQVFVLDVTSDLAWTGTSLSDANLRVRVKCFKQGSGGNPTGNLRWLPVKVSYTP